MKQINKNIVLVLALVFASIYSYAAPLVLKGTIGKSTIYLEIEEEGPEYFGKYFYQKQLIDIPIQGKLINGVYKLNSYYEFSYGEEPLTETFTFSKKGTKYVGKWMKGSKQLPLSLSPVPVAELSPKKLQSNKQLSSLTLSGINLPKLNYFKLKGNDTLTMHEGVRIKRFTEITTGIEIMRIDSGLTKSKMDFVNAHLERMQIEFFFDMLDCSSYNGELADFGVNYSLGIINEDLFSMSFFNYYYCNGMPHPEEANYSYNLDLNSQKELKNTDYLSEYALASKDELTMFQKCLMNYFKKIVPELFDENTNEENSEMIGAECGYYMSELWEPSVNVCFTREGMQVIPYFSHMMAPCLEPEWAIIPYSELKGIIDEPYYSQLLKIKP
ncbi:MAG: hypothetical protein IT221_15770 [Fluviicola sp.]|nr:hypothetical protein [Fluviicola sp.]